MNTILGIVLNYLNLTIPMNISLIPLAPISHCADNTQKISEYPPLFLMLIPLQRELLLLDSDR